jgi:hypothetical protein
MKRLVLSAGAMIALVATADTALACKCPVTSREAGLSSAEVVFRGRVVSIATSGGSQVTTMKVTRAIKGVANGATIRVRSRTSSKACGFDFRGKSRVLVAGEHAEPGVVRLRHCTMRNLNS